MLPTLTFMKQTFRRFNYEYFHGSLPTPTFKISSSSVYMGTCARYPSVNAYGASYNTYVITCSKYFDCPLEELENTMLHEMCHLWVFINHPYTTEPSHGPIWQSIANRVTVATNNKYIITPASTSRRIFINPKMRRPPRKSSRPPSKPRTTYKPSFRHTLLRTLFLLMILVLFL